MGHDQTGKLWGCKHCRECSSKGFGPHFAAVGLLTDSNNLDAFRSKMLEKPAQGKARSIEIRNCNGVIKELLSRHKLKLKTSSLLFEQVPNSKGQVDLTLTATFLDGHEDTVGLIAALIDNMELTRISVLKKSKRLPC
jgi:hypothetical protein